MSGVWVLGELLTAHVGLVTLLGDNIKGGALDAVPSLSLNRVSRQRLPALSSGAKRWTERVQATAQARDYEEQVAIIAMAHEAADYQIGAFAGVVDVSVTPAGDGPDFILTDPTVWGGSCDFIVSYTET
ncbi:hypothetical protein [Rhizorhabdus histidinilytica]|uniref:hypothetical protein n=1 Tax=Rhizorhabdus histidinilytica TaxID=439228 RepID=UPI003220040E